MQSFQWKFIILCLETVTKNLLNWHKKSNLPEKAKKAKFQTNLAFF